MSRQIGALGKPFTAPWILTEKRFLPCMRSHVSSEVKIQRKSFPTNFALVVPFFGVNKSVTFQFWFIQKSLVTAIKLTYKLLFSVMNLMFFKFRWIVEKFCAQWEFTFKYFLFFLTLCGYNRLFIFSNPHPSLNPYVFIFLKTILNFSPTVSPIPCNFWTHIHCFALFLLFQRLMFILLFTTVSSLFFSSFTPLWSLLYLRSINFSWLRILLRIGSFVIFSAF